MYRLIFPVAFSWLLFFGFLNPILAQTHTYSEVEMAEMKDGDVGVFQKAKAKWAITNTDRGYKIKVSGQRDTIEVRFIALEEGQYLYRPRGGSMWNGKRVVYMMTNEKMSDYAKFNESDNRLIIINYSDGQTILVKLLK
jgi:lipopolysaccharide export LptBFGC system permease protein LptF